MGFSLSPEKEKSLRATVLTQAVGNARSDADVTAAATDVTHHWREISCSGIRVCPCIRQPGITVQPEMKAVAVPTPIETGQIKVSAQVSISYLIT